MDTTKIVEKIKYGNVELKMKTTTLQAKSVDPSVDEQFVFPDSEYGGLSSVTVTGVTNSIDKNIIPGNIRKGKIILGVEGDMEPDKPDQTKIVTPTKQAQEVYADQGYELLSVTIEGVTSDIDENIQADNIRYGVEILGVVGSMEQKEDLDAELNEQEEQLGRLKGDVEDLPILEFIGDDLTAQEALISDIQTQLDNIPEVEQIPVEDATATESDVLAGKTFFSGNDELKTGMLEVPDLSATTATADDVLQGKKFYNAQGEFVEGSRPNKLNQYLNKTIEHITKEDLDGLTKPPGFMQWTSLKSIGIPDSVTSFPSDFCSYCTNLETVTFGENPQITSFYANAFMHCRNLKSITIPSSVTSIGSYTFFLCSSLTNIVIPSKVTTIREKGFSNSGLIDVVFEENSQLTTLGEEVFSSCAQLVNINLPNTLTTLGNYAFASCRQITQITLPATVTTVGNNCFDWCTALKSITVLATIPPTLSGTFWRSEESPYKPNDFEAIYIPKGTLSAYESATNWSAYAGKFVELEA